MTLAIIYHAIVLYVGLVVCVYFPLCRIARALERR